MGSYNDIQAERHMSDKPNTLRGDPRTTSCFQTLGVGLLSLRGEAFAPPHKSGRNIALLSGGQLDFDIGSDHSLVLLGWRHLGFFIGCKGVRALLR